MQLEENKWIIYQSWLRSDFSRVMNWGVVELRIGFLSFFSPLSIPLLSLSLPSSAYEQRGVYTTHREIIDPWRNHWRIVRGWLIPRRWLPGQWPRVERKPVLLLVVSLLDLCIKTRVFCVLIQPPPLLSPKMCVFLPIQTRLFCVLKVFG